MMNAHVFFFVLPFNSFRCSQGMGKGICSGRGRRDRGSTFFSLTDRVSKTTSGRASHSTKLVFYPFTLPNANFLSFPAPQPHPNIKGSPLTSLTFLHPFSSPFPLSAVCPSHTQHNSISVFLPLPRSAPFFTRPFHDQPWGLPLISNWTLQNHSRSSSISSKNAPRPSVEPLSFTWMPPRPSKSPQSPSLATVS